MVIPRFKKTLQRAADNIKNQLAGPMIGRFDIFKVSHHKDYTFHFKIQTMTELQSLQINQFYPN